MKNVHKYLVAALFAGLFILTGMALADDAKPELGKSIWDLIDAVKVGATAPIIVAAVQLLKTDLVGGLLSKLNANALRLVMAVATVAGNVAASAGSKGWLAAAVEGLFMSGGAMLIYDTIRSVKSS